MEFSIIDIFDSKLKRTQHYICDHYPEFYQYILNNYPEELTWSEKLYWCCHNIDKYPTCPTCGDRLKFKNFIRGYNKYCSSKCNNSNPEKKLQVKQTCLKKYGVGNPFQSEVAQNKYKQTCLKRYGVKHYSQLEEFQNKYKQTCLERYGVENSFQSEAIKNKIRQINIEKYGSENPSQSELIKNKKRQTCLKNYCVDNPSKSQLIRNKVKQTCLNRYGSEYYTQSEEFQSRHDEIQTKINNTKHQNHTFNSSEIESDFASYLDSQNIEYKRQYRSKEYPFNCDFYLPKYDLYIEIQASWTHGHHPFDIETDRGVLKTWNSKNTDYYKAAIETWTERDVNKRGVAKQNQLNYLEIFSNNVDEAVEKFEKYINDKISDYQRIR